MNIKSILIIDDNPDVLVIEKMAFKTFSQVEVFTADNADDGLLIAKQKLPDLVMTDALLVEMTGFEVCRLLKREPLTAHIPVVLISAKMSAEDQIAAQEAGAVGFLVKQSDPQRFVNTVLSIAHSL